MTNVLPFPRTGEQSGGKSAAEAPSATYKANILLFTGVRYERHADLESLDAPSDTLGRDDTPGTRRRKARRRA
jgi:hypothetical protein